MAGYQVTYEIKNTVRAQLQDLFSTPKGTLILDPDYGMDFGLIDTDLGIAFDVYEFKDNIRSQIRKYIPRIDAERAEITVQYSPGTGAMAVKINDIFINVTESVTDAAHRRL